MYTIFEFDSLFKEKLSRTITEARIQDLLTQKVVEQNIQQTTYATSRCRCLHGKKNIVLTESNLNI